MKKNTPMLLLALLLLLLLMLLVSILLRLSGNTDSTTPTENIVSKPTGSTVITDPPTDPPTTPPTEPPTDAPTEPPTEPPTEAPTEPDQEYIGTLYTRQELEAMENESKGYGPGRTSDGKRAPYAVTAQNKYGKYGGNFIAPDNGNIYLTFDCGYEYIATDADGSKYRVTERILDTLKEKGVKAVFFVTMHYVKDQPDLVRRMIAEGHAVGNHTNSHPVMTSISIDRMVNEVMSLHDYVLDTFGYKMTLFRPPTGAYSTRSLAVVQSLGYKNVHWSFAYADYEDDDQPDVAKSLDLVTRSHHSGAIYLLHAISTTNAALLGDAIDFFRAEGYNLELFQ